MRLPVLLLLVNSAFVIAGAVAGVAVALWQLEREQRAELRAFSSRAVLQGRADAASDTPQGGGAGFATRAAASLEAGR